MATYSDQPVGPYHARFARGINGTDSILQTPFPQIAFVGRSNVGKSSTINAILGVSGLARTSATPGKTQEINFFTIGDRMFFVDLPGYGFARMPDREREAIRKHILWYLSGGEVTPHLVVLIIDAKAGLSEHDKELLALVQQEGFPLLILMNKTDKLNQSERARAVRTLAEEAPGVEFIPFSAKTKLGVAEVRARVGLTN